MKDSKKQHAGLVYDPADKEIFFEQRKCLEKLYDFIRSKFIWYRPCNRRYYCNAFMRQIDGKKEFFNPFTKTRHRCHTSLRRTRFRFCRSIPSLLQLFSKRRIYHFRHDLLRRFYWRRACILARMVYRWKNLFKRRNTRRRKEKIFWYARYCRVLYATRACDR